MKVGKTKAKKDFPQTEVEYSPEAQRLLARFSPEEIETGVVRPPAGAYEGVGGSLEDILNGLHDAILEESVAGLLRTARDRRGMTLDDLAEKLGVSRSRAHQIEQPKANLRLDSLQRVAWALGYDVQIVLLPTDGETSPITASLGREYGVE